MQRSKTISLFVVSVFLILSFCQACVKPNKNIKEQPVTVTGVAHNGKGGALISSSNGEVYYIEGLDSWITDVENKVVTVSGNLKVDTLSDERLKNDKGEWTQGLSGKIMTIQNAQWKIAEIK
jgi:hypothetical protein